MTPGWSVTPVITPSSYLFRSGRAILTHLPSVVGHSPASSIFILRRGRSSPRVWLLSPGTVVSPRSGPTGLIRVILRPVSRPGRS